MNEEMREIPGYHGRYFMDENGGVWSQTRAIRFGNSIQRPTFKQITVSEKGYVALNNPKNRITKHANHAALYASIYPEKIKS